MSVSVILCAAGKGTRAGFSNNKIFALYEGIPVIERTISAFLLPEITQLIVAYNKEDEEEMLALLSTDGMLVKRPLLIGEAFVLNGFKESDWESAVKPL